jgi:uncharacterized NAD(P)/FAD-binding protein YdhS
MYMHLIGTCQWASRTSLTEVRPAAAERHDELALGLDTTLVGNAIAAKGEVMPERFLVGTLRKPRVWESTAVPELRNQAAAVANRVLSRLNQSCEAAAE